MEREAQLKKVLERAGGPSALAKRLGTSVAAVSQWRRVPANRVGSVAAIVDLEPHEIRPDLFSAPGKAA